MPVTATPTPTPTLDRLAANGLRGTRFPNTRRCCPIRASLLTGLYAHQAGISRMTDDEGQPGDRGELSHNAVALAEVLKPAGCRSDMSGKFQKEGLAGMAYSDRVLANMNHHPNRKPAMITIRTLVLTVLATCSSVFADGGWIEIFNGKDLANWKVSEENPGSFSVKDGMLLVDGPRAHLFYQEDGGDAKLRNFEFEAMIKTFPEANSGVFFHTQWQARGWPAHGYEAQVNATHGDPRKTGSIYSVKDVLNDAPHKDGEWFTYHIRVEGKRIIVKVNGEVVNDYTEPEDPGHATRRLGVGTIAIQAHDPKSVIHYKNLRLRKLP